MIEIEPHDASTKDHCMLQSLSIFLDVRGVELSDSCLFFICALCRCDACMFCWLASYIFCFHWRQLVMLFVQWKQGEACTPIEICWMVNIKVICLLVKQISLLQITSTLQNWVNVANMACYWGSLWSIAWHWLINSSRWHRCTLAQNGMLASTSNTIIPLRNIFWVKKWGIMHLLKWLTKTHHQCNFKSQLGANVCF